MLKPILASLLLSASVVAGDEEFDILKRVPQTRHAACGLTRLSDIQARNLSAAVRSLMLDAYALGQDNPKPKTNTVAVIAPSISTKGKAREIRLSLRLEEAKPRHAETILVVVRSALLNPLNRQYDSFGELRADADKQLNIAGPNYHIYRYSMDDDLQVTQIEHVSEKARLTGESPESTTSAGS